MNKRSRDSIEESEEDTIIDDNFEEYTSTDDKDRKRQKMGLDTVVIKVKNSYKENNKFTFEKMMKYASFKE